MRIALLTLCFIVSVTATAQARLGETADQLVARYGQSLSQTDQKAEGDKIASSKVVFQKGGFEIDVIFADGVSVAESFKKLNSAALTVEEVQTLLNANSQGHGWEAPQMAQGEKTWSRDDGATAQLAQDGSLTIKSKELIIKETAAKKVATKPTLDGF